MSNQRRSRPSAILACCLAALGAACTQKPAPVEVIIALEQPAQGVRSATILVDYSEAPGSPLVTEGRPACASLLPDVQAEFSDDGAGALTIQTSSGAGFSAPAELAVCRMVGKDASVTADAISAGLHVSLQGGVGMNGQRLDDRRMAQGRTRKDSGESEARTGDSGEQPMDRPATEPDDEAAPRQATADTPQPGLAPAPQTGAPPVPGGAAQPGAKQQGLVAQRPDRAPADEAEDRVAGLQQSGRTPPDPLGTGNNEPQANDESDDDTRAVAYAVSIGVTTSSGALGALQFDIRHVGANGGWLGAGSGAVCTPDVPVALATFNDRGDRWLSAAMVDLSGISTPGPVVTCTFKSREPVSAGNFSVQVIDAAGLDAEPAARPEPFPVMAVTNVSALN